MARCESLYLSGGYSSVPVRVDECVILLIGKVIDKQTICAAKGQTCEGGYEVTASQIIMRYCSRRIFV